MANVAEFQSRHIDRYRVVLAAFEARRHAQVESVDPRTPGVAHYGEADIKAGLARLDALEQAVLLGRPGAERRLELFLANPTVVTL